MVSPSQISIVLVETTQPGNIGATARAMDNMGVNDLRLVNPCEYFHPEARMFAMNARYLLSRASVFSSVKDAVADRQLIIGTSARQRERISQLTNIYSLPEILRNYSAQVSIAIVFGPEQSGLNNKDLSFCNEWITIPTYGQSSSLNLAQAVLVVLYEMSKYYRQTFDSQGKIIIPASSEKLESMKMHFFQVLETIGFLRYNSREVMWNSFSELIGKAKPNDRDVRMLRGFFNKIEVALKRRNRSS